MASIVERLRAEPPRYGNLSTSQQMREDAADEIERLEKLLKGRDEFIVNSGLWHEFVANLEAS